MTNSPLTISWVSEFGMESFYPNLLSSQLVPATLIKSLPGTLELNLNNMPAPAKKSGGCGLDQLPDMNRKKGGHDVKMISLFENKRAKGFWPCYNDETGEKVLTVLS